MDFHSMKRKQLQALCKKHNIPANLSNLDMANKLAQFLEENENSTRVVVKEQEEIVNDAESNNMVDNRRVKKVRFSPENELIEFSRVQELKRKSRRNSISRAESNLSVEIVGCGQANTETVGRRGRTRRIGESKMMEEEVQKEKREAKVVKSNDGKNNASVGNTFEDDKLEEGNAVEPGRVTRSRGKMEALGVKNISAREKKVAKDNIKSDDKASDDVNNEKNEEIVGNHRRVTRSRTQKLVDVPSKVGKRVVKKLGDGAAVLPEAVGNRESGSDSLSKRGDGGEGTSSTVLDEGIHDKGGGLKGNLVKKQNVVEHAAVEPQVVLRKSKRRANINDESEMFNKDTKEHENGGFKDQINTSELSVSDGSRVDAEVTASEVNLGRRAVEKIGEPIKKVEPRRSDRRKTLVESDDLKAETEKKSDIVPGVSKDDKMVLQPIGVLRRSRRKTLCLELDSANDTDSAVENLQTEEHGRACKVEPRRSNRRKTLVESDALKAETENKDVVPGVSEDDKMVLQPIGVLRRSRRKTSYLELDSANDTDSAGENLQTEEHVSDPSLMGKEDSAVQRNSRSRSTSKREPPGILDTAGGNSNLHQNNKVMKRKRGLVSGDVITNNNNYNSEAQSLKGSSSKKVVSAFDTGRVADEGMQPRQLDNPNMLEASSHSSSEIGDALFVDVQLPVSKGPESECGMKEKVSIADISGSYCMSFNGEDLTNSGTNAACKIEGDSTVSDQNCTSNIREVEKGNLQLESDTQQAPEKNITDVDKNPETQVHGQMGDSCCSIKINDQVLGDGLCVSGKEGSEETRSSGGSHLLDDQTEVKNLKVAEIEADDCLQPCTGVADQHNALDHLEASRNSVDNNNEDASQTAGEVGTFVSYETEYTHSTGASKLKGAASSMTRYHGDKVIEELAQADEDGCSKECGSASNHISEYDMIDLCNGETCEGESPTGKISKCDDDGEFGLSNLFDADGRCGVTPQDTEKFPGESSKGHESKCDEDGNISLANLFDLPALPTMGVDYNEVKSGRDCSHSVEKDPSTPSSISETQDAQKSQLAKSNDLANTNTRKATWSNANELAADAACFSKSYAEGKISLVTEGLSADEDDKENSAGAYISDVKNSLINKIAAESPSDDVKFQDSVKIEQQHKIQQPKLTESDAGVDVTHATGRKRWAEIELDYLFGTTSDEDTTSLGLDDTSCQGNQVENMTMSENKSMTNHGGSLMKQKGKEMEGECINDSEKTNYKDVVWPTGFNADTYENELKFLFATPVKTTPCKIEDASVTSIKEGSDATKETVATVSTSDKKARNAGYEVEDNLCFGASLLDYRGDDICEEINEVESFTTLDTATEVLSGCDVLEDQLAQNKEECMQDTNLVKEEDKNERVIPLAQSCLEDEAAEKNNISTSGSPWDLYELESCAHMSECLSCPSKAQTKSKREMMQNTEAVVESTDSDLQKSENSHLLAAGSDDEEALVETSSVPEEAKTGSFQKDVADKEGLYPFLFSNPDCENSIREIDEQDDAKILDVKDANPELSQDISAELQTNTKVEIQNSVTEHDSFGLMAVSGPLSSLPMPAGLGYHKNGDTNLEAGDFKVESIKLKDTSTTDSKTEYDGYEASEDQLIDITGACEKETTFIAEDHEENADSLGQPSLSDGGKDHGSESAEESPISLSGPPSNLDKLNGCQDMLTDTALSERLSSNSRVDKKSEQEMTQRSEAACELSEVDVQKFNFSKSSHLGGCFEDDKISEEASLNIFSGPLVAELADISNFDGQSIEEGTSLHEFSKVSPDDLNGAKICDEMDANAQSSKDMSDEPHINSEVENLKTFPDSDNLCDGAYKHPCSVELESAFLEAKETGATTQDPNTIFAPAEHGSSVCGAISSILSSSEMHLPLREDIDDFKNLDSGTPFFNLNGDNDKKNSEPEENSTAQIVEFSTEELHFEENVEDLKNDDARTISNSPASECNEMLKESDVADTIKEYIDSESSLSVIFGNSTGSLSSDMLAHTDEMIASENSALPKQEDDVGGSLVNSKDEENSPSVDCVETETKEHEEAALSMEPAQATGNAANSAGCVGLTEGSVELSAQAETGQMSSPNALGSTMRKNAIHGTSNKLLTMADMKENAPTHKKPNIGDITAARPAKRRALQNVEWK